MRIVLLTAIPFWHPGTSELINELRKEEFSVVALDIFHGRLFTEQNESINILPFKLKGVWARIYLYLFRKKIIQRIIRHDDILDIHFVEPYYSKYLLDLNNKLICSLFGSDLFRTSQDQKKMQIPLFNKADRIVLSKNMLPYFEENFGSMPNKYCFNQYGSNRLDEIIKQKKQFQKAEIKSNWNIPLDKIILTIGYNNKKEQQHLSIITELQKLPSSIIKSTFLIFPLTYGDCGFEYLSAIKVALEKTSFSYLLLEKSLSDQEIVDFRLLSDITINMQTTDALASSIKEAFAAGDMLLIGEWLPYNIYDDLGVHYQKINFNNLATSIIETISNLNDSKIQLDKNTQIIENFASWSFLIKDWTKLYKTL